MQVLISPVHGRLVDERVRGPVWIFFTDLLVDRVRDQPSPRHIADSGSRELRIQLTFRRSHSHYMKPYISSAQEVA
jgi:hypothetical protein